MATVHRCHPNRRRQRAARHHGSSGRPQHPLFDLSQAPHRAALRARRRDDRSLSRSRSFGYIYLAQTFTGFGTLPVGWGHDGVLPTLVAQKHSLAGVLSAPAFCGAPAAGSVYLVLAVLCHVLGYDCQLQSAVGLGFLGAVLIYSSRLQGHDPRLRTHRHPGICARWPTALVGFSRDPRAVLRVGRMRSVLVVADVAIAIALLFVLRSLRLVGVNKLSIERGAFSSLFFGGIPFVFFGLAMALQPNIDAVLLSKLGSVEAVGWFAVARRLIGLLLFPASALIGALYPTLCRLWAEDRGEFERVARGSLHSVGLLVMPIALCSALYPDVGIAIFSKKAFGPAADDLRVLSVFLFLVYFTMPIGTCVLAAGRQRAWSVVQSLCVVVSLVLDWPLIPWFQRRFGNGGLGPCVASVVSEIVVVICGLALMPRGIFDARLRRSLFFAILAGSAMAAVAWLTRSVTPFVAAPAAVIAYVAALGILGEIDRSHVAKVRDVIARKLSRAR